MDVAVFTERALNEIRPIKPASLSQEQWRQVAVQSLRTDYGNRLPEYYLVYMLLVDLLRFDAFGPFDKVAWSIPIEFDGRVYLVEHRQRGLGVFAPRFPDAELQVAKILRRISNAISTAEPYFRWRARRAIENSQVSVTNLSSRLYDRYCFFLEQYRLKCREAEENAGRVERTYYRNGIIGESYPEVQLRREIEWLAFSVIDSFFSWSEHIFVHLAILRGKCTTAAEVEELMTAGDWSHKFEKALDKADHDVTRYHGDLVEMRRMFRNFAAHGAFGTNREGFVFYSGAGAVPMTLSHLDGEHSYHFGGEFDHFRSGVSFVGQEQVELMEDFIEFIRSGPLAPAWIYLDAGLSPSLLAAERNRLYSAMESEDAMDRLVEVESYFMDKYANMEY